MTNYIKEANTLLGNDTNLVGKNTDCINTTVAKNVNEENENCSCDCWKNQKQKELYNAQKLIGLFALLVENFQDENGIPKWGAKLNVSGLARDLLKVLNNAENQISGLSERNIRKLIQVGRDELGISN